MDKLYFNNRKLLKLLYSPAIVYYTEIRHFRHSQSDLCKTSGNPANKYCY